MMVFWKHGYEATGVAQLCEAMGISKQSLYDWAGDKRGLYLMALERYYQNRVCGLGQHLSEEGSPLKNLIHCLDAIVAYAKQPNCIGCLLTNSQNEFGTSDAELGKLTASVESYIVAAFRDVLERAQAANEIPKDIDCEAMATALAVIRNGLMLAGRAGQPASFMDQTIQTVKTMLRIT